MEIDLALGQVNIPQKREVIVIADNLSDGVNNEQLRTVFFKYGNPKVKVVFRKRPQRASVAYFGFAGIIFENEQNAKEALVALNGKKFQGPPSFTLDLRMASQQDASWFSKPTTKKAPLKKQKTTTTSGSFSGAQLMQLMAQQEEQAIEVEKREEEEEKRKAIVKVPEPITTSSTSVSSSISTYPDVMPPLENTQNTRATIEKVLIFPLMESTFPIIPLDTIKDDDILNYEFHIIHFNTLDIGGISLPTEVAMIVFSLSSTKVIKRTFHRVIDPGVSELSKHLSSIWESHNLRNTPLAKNYEDLMNELWGAAMNLKPKPGVPLGQWGSPIPTLWSKGPSKHTECFKWLCEKIGKFTEFPEVQPIEDILDHFKKVAKRQGKTPKKVGPLPDREKVLKREKCEFHKLPLNKDSVCAIGNAIYMIEYIVNQIEGVGIEPKNDQLMPNFK